MEFRDGDDVEILLKGTISGNGAYGRRRVKTPNGQSNFVYLDDSVRVTRVISDWPPQPGDIWESKGEEYAVLWACRPNGPVNATIHATMAAVMYEVDDFLKFPWPRLIRRREAS